MDEGHPDRHGPLKHDDRRRLFQAFQRHVRPSRRRHLPWPIGEALAAIADANAESVARYGGEEFCSLRLTSDANRAMQVADHTRIGGKACRSTPDKQLSIRHSQRRGRNRRRETASPRTICWKRPMRPCMPPNAKAGTPWWSMLWSQLLPSNVTRRVACKALTQRGLCG